MSGISSPPIRYTGGKWNLAPWIIEHFPKHICYVEPFCGGAGLLFRKSPSIAEVINDLNHQIVNFFQILRTRPDDLINAIDLTPHSRYELEMAATLTNDPLENARRFYVRSYQAFMSGEADKPMSWRYQLNKSNLINRWNKTDHLITCAARLKMVQIECDTAEAVITRFDAPETLFYVDPPYVHSSREGSTDYKFEMNDSDHEILAKQLNGLEGMVVLSGYDSEIYRDLYQGWKLATMESVTIRSTKKTECLWISPRAQANHAQKRLF